MTLGRPSAHEWADTVSEMCSMLVSMRFRLRRPEKRSAQLNAVREGWELKPCSTQRISATPTMCQIRYVALLQDALYGADREPHGSARAVRLTHRRNPGDYRGRGMRPPPMNFQCQASPMFEVRPIDKTRVASHQRGTSAVPEPSQNCPRPLELASRIETGNRPSRRLISPWLIGVENATSRFSPCIRVVRCEFRQQHHGGGNGLKTTLARMSNRWERVNVAESSAKGLESIWLTTGPVELLAVTDAASAFSTYPKPPAHSA